MQVILIIPPKLLNNGKSFKAIIYWDLYLITIQQCGMEDIKNKKNKSDKTRV